MRHGFFPTMDFGIRRVSPQRFFEGSAKGRAFVLGASPSSVPCRTKKQPETQTALNPFAFMMKSLLPVVDLP
jgi:hypothetical protein